MRYPDQPAHPAPVPTPDPTADHPSTPDGAAWSTIVEAIREAGARAGSSAADWWAQDTVGARASGDTNRTARTVLAGLDDGDPAVCDALPAFDASRAWAEAPSDADLYTDAAPAGAPPWQRLAPARRDEAIDAYRDGFDTAAHDRVARHCRLALPATTDTTDVEGEGVAGAVHRTTTSTTTTSAVAGRRRS